MFFLISDTLGMCCFMNVYHYCHKAEESSTGSAFNGVDICHVDRLLGHLLIPETHTII